MPLPKSLTVGPTRYAMQTHSRLIDEQNALGRTNNNQSIIQVDPNQGVDLLRVTVLHEAMHAAFWTYGASHILGLGDEDEERVIQALAPAFLALLRDNPKLVEYLTEK